MLWPYKMMFSGLIPYLREEGPGQHPSTRVTPLGDTAQGVILLWSQHPAKLPGVGEWGSVPSALPQLLTAGHKVAALHPQKDQGAARAELPDEFWGVLRLTLASSSVCGPHLQWEAPIAWATLQARPSYSQDRGGRTCLRAAP